MQTDSAPAGARSDAAEAVAAEAVAIRPEAKDYVGKLVDAINDNAKIARTTGLALLLTGLYLIAAIFSASDEAILRGSTARVGQLGIEIPLVLSFSIAPPIFAFLHINALIQFDHLTRLLGRLEDLLAAHVPDESDRRHYRSILTSAAFVPLQALRAGRREPAPGDDARFADRVGVALYAAIEWFTITCFPILVLVASQLGFLRYQSSAITLLHTATLLADLAALWWFHARRRRDSGTQAAGAAAPRARLRAVAPAMLGSGLVVGGLMALFAQIPGPEAATVGRHRMQAWWEARAGGNRIARNAAALATQPVDLLLCEWQDRFCRFLQARNTVLLGREPSAPILAALARGQLGRAQLDEIVGLSLRSRTLRFADFAEAKMPKADLIAADLRGARLADAQIQAADLRLARLGAADFSRSHLEGANLYEAVAPLARFLGSRMQGARLERGRFPLADFTSAQLRGADLEDALLSLAGLAGAQLEGSHLKAADLRGADLARADLDFAMLDEAQLERAELERTSLVGASLARARSGETCLEGARAIATDLRLNDAAPDPNVLLLVTKRAIDLIDRELGRGAAPGSFDRLLGKARCTAPPAKQADTVGPIAAPGSTEGPDSEDFHRQLASALTRFGCADELGATVVLRRLRAASAAAPSPRYVRLTAAGLLAENCPAARALSESARAGLARLAADPGR